MWKYDNGEMAEQPTKQAEVACYSCAAFGEAAIFITKKNDFVSQVRMASVFVSISLLLYNTSETGNLWIFTNNEKSL